MVENGEKEIISLSTVSINLYYHQGQKIVGRRPRSKTDGAFLVRPYVWGEGRCSRSGHDHPGVQIKVTPPVFFILCPFALYRSSLLLIFANDVHA